MILQLLKRHAAHLAIVGFVLAAMLAPAAYDFLSDAGLAPRGYDVHYRQVALRGGIVEDFTIRGTTPTVTIGDAGAEDTGLVFDGNAQDFYVSLDDSADDLVIGLGSVVGTTPILAFDENQASTFSGDALITGTTPLLTVGDGGNEDAGVLFDGDGAQDFYIGFDTTTDDLYIGYGTTIGANAGITIQEDGTTTVSGLTVSASPVVNAGDNTDADIGFNWDHLTNDWYFEVDADDNLLYMGLGTVAATTPAFQVNASQVMTFYQDPIFGGATPRVTIGDAAAEDTSLVYDGIAQDYYIGLEDVTDDLVIGLGSVLGTTEAIAIDENLDIRFHDATASDFLITFDGNAQDYYLGLDDSSDDLVFGAGNVMDTTETMRFNGAANITFHDTTAADFTLVFDGNVQDFYACLDDSADDLVFGFGSVCGTTQALAITEAADLLLGEDVTITIFGLPAADASGDLLDLTATFAANATAGTETLLGLDLNLTAGTVAAGDVIRGIDLNLTNADGDSTDTGILIAGAWDVALDVQSLRIDLDSDSDTSLRASADDVLTIELAGADLWTISTPAAAGAGGDLLDLTATFAAMNGSDTLIGWDINLTGANHTGTANVLTGLDLALTTPDAQARERAIVINGNWDAAIDTPAPVIATAAVWFDDFFGDTVDPAWDTSISGTDPQAVQAIVVEQYGVYQVTSGNAGTGIAVDGEGLFGGLEWTADQGSLIFEARLHLDAAITTTSICVGLTDLVGLEMPATIGGADAITTNASDAVVFCYDSRADTDQWFAIGVDTDVDATGNAATGTAPAADTYQVLRIEISSDGVEARFYIDGTLVITTTASTVTPTALLTPVVIIEPASSANSMVVDIDYIYVGAQRA